MGLLQDPKFWQGLKITFKVFKAKLQRVGSNKLSVNILGRINSVILIISLFLAPVYTYAGVTDFACSIFGLFCPTHVQAEDIQVNSQNMALLQATITPDPSASSTSDESSIIEGNSLFSEIKSSDLKTINDDQISLYVVHPGDTLPAIAKMFGVSVNTIRWGNDIKGSTITVGQTLVILPINGIQHIVKSGDTLQSITKQHKGDLDEILQYNNLAKNSKLAIGDVIFIPDGEAVATPSSTGSSGVGKTAPSYPIYDGYYMRPIIGGIKTQGIHGHNGVDLASSHGAKIFAAADGDVIISKSSGWNGGYGSYVVLRHNNGTQTLYGHLSGTAVSVGQHVTQGQTIGYMGRSGQVTGSTGVHLHFEIRGAKNPF